MPQDDPPADPAPAGADDAARTMGNVLVLAVADGALTDAEKACIERLRERLGLDAGRFRRLCQEVRAGRRSIRLDADPAEVEKALAALVELAVADGKVSPVEFDVLRRVARRAGVNPARLDAAIDRAGDADERARLAAEEMTGQIYRHFAEWDDATRRRKLAAFAELGIAAVRPLVRILESYRRPDGMPDTNLLKTLVVEQLGRLGDSRPVYYLAQQVNLGDIEDEITCFELRAAAAEAIGKITGEGFSRDADGIAAARRWWQETGSARYDHLMF